ncbi:MAG TPA: porin [Aestuariivirgaceae bacterium]|jgi:phosphate-selective porin OprO/OprP
MTGGLKTISRYLLASAGVIGIFAAAPEAKAQQAQDLQQIQAQIQEMQATIQALQKQVQDAKAQAAAANATAANAGGSDLDLKVKWKGAPELSSADGKFKMKIRGRLQADYNAIDQDENLNADPITGFPDVSAAEIRRARLGVEGVVFYNVGYKFEVDFANDETALKDAYVEYLGLYDGLALRAGNFKTPNSLDEMTSSRFLTFLERAAFVEAYGLDRQIGAGVIYGSDHWTLSAGIFGPEPFDDEVWRDDVKTGAARVTWAPINREVNSVHQVLHLGASWRGRDGAEDLRPDRDPDPLDDEFFRYRARGADLHLADRFVATPQIFDEDTFWGVEGAAIWGPVHVAGEYTELEADVGNFDVLCVPGSVGCVNGRFPGSNPTYVGWYAEAGWFLTGESRGYKEGEFVGVKVKNPVLGGGKGGGWGAWQIAGRYDVIELSDKATTFTGVTDVAGVTFGRCSQCGDQETWEVVLNWWLNDYTGLQFQYSESDIDGGPLFFANSTTSANRDNGSNVKGFGTRMRYYW